MARAARRMGRRQNGPADDAERREQRSKHHRPPAGPAEDGERQE